MYNKEKAKENYIQNRDKLNEKSKQYYHDHKEARQKYNNEYWAEHKSKYSEQRKYDREFKNKQKEYYQVYKYRPKVNIDHKKGKNNIKFVMILNNHKPQPLILSHTLYFD